MLCMLYHGKIYCCSIGLNVISDENEEFEEHEKDKEVARIFNQSKDVQ